jgi:hypothetical protein
MVHGVLMLPSPAYSTYVQYSIRKNNQYQLILLLHAVAGQWLLLSKKKKLFEAEGIFPPGGGGHSPTPLPVISLSQCWHDNPPVNKFYFLEPAKRPLWRIWAPFEVLGLWFREPPFFSLLHTPPHPFYHSLFSKPLPFLLIKAAYPSQCNIINIHSYV